MKNLKQFAATLVASAALAFAGSASASTVVDTGSPDGQGYNWVVGSHQSLFGLFTSDVNTITEIGGYFSKVFDNTSAAPITATIYKDVSGAPDLNSALGGGTFFATDTSNIVRLGISGLSIAVNVGESYWIGFSGDVSNYVTAPQTVPSPLLAYASKQDGGPVNFDNDLKFGAYVVGENVTGGVPEPGTWALMIIGFGAAGAVLRRHPRTLAA